MLRLLRCGTALWVIVIAAAVFATGRNDGELEERFELLRVRYEAAREDYRERYKTRSEEFDNDAEAYRRFYYENFPANTMPGEFLSLEKDARGSLVGLSCLSLLVENARPVSEKGNEPIWAAYETAIARLRNHYIEHPDLDVVLRHVRVWRHEGATRELLQQAAESPHCQVRGYALLQLAKVYSAEGDGWQNARGLLDLIEGQSNFADLAQEMRRIVDRHSSAEIEKIRGDVIETCERITREYADVLYPPSTGRGPQILRIDRDASVTSSGRPRKSLGEGAESLMFETRNLMVGCEAPSIAGPDVAGRPLTLSDFRGKAVVLMFSFEGCGPCEEMYPENRKLIEEMAGRPFAFVGVMGDETPETVEQAVADGTITWPVWHDGSPGPIETRWNVSSWPTIYVLDHKGIIRYRELRSDYLELAVRKLVAEAEAATVSADEQ